MKEHHKLESAFHLWQVRESINI